MNVSELLRLLQAEHDEATARADTLREQIERLTAALAETEARLAELTATRKVIDGLTPPQQAPTTAETATVHQRIVTASNERKHLEPCPARHGGGGARSGAGRQPGPGGPPVGSVTAHPPADP